jgi:hypothetical protein
MAKYKIECRLLQSYSLQDARELFKTKKTKDDKKTGQKTTKTHRQISWQRALLNNSRSIAITNEHCFTWSYMSVL